MWIAPTGNDWNDLELIKRIGLGHEMTFEEGDGNKTDAENAINWLGRRVMELSQMVSWATGDIKHTISTVVPTGWLLLDNRTIGSASSNADVKGASYEALFTFIWGIADNSYLLNSDGTSTTKGVSANSDWVANKRIYLPRVAGRVLCATGQGSGLTNRSLGASFGAETTSYTPSGSVGAISTTGITATCGSISTTGITATATGGSATCSSIDIWSLTATCSPIDIGALTATCSSIDIGSLTATCSPIDIGALTCTVTLNNPSTLTVNTPIIQITPPACSKVKTDPDTGVDVISCLDIDLNMQDVADALMTNVTVTSAVIGGSIPTPTITIGGSIPTPTVTIGGSIPTPTVTIGGSIPTPTITVTQPTVTIGGSIASPTVTIGGTIASPTFTGTGVNLSIMQPTLAVNFMIKI